jgi:alkylated DNA nucleotide flippase Atl1/GNAT superfamily N-acetyltransferase
VYQRIFAAVRRIPAGRVCTYGEIARVAAASGARQVGYALHSLDAGADVPWHRVINARGLISLPGDNGVKQRQLLRRERVASVTPAHRFRTYGWVARMTDIHVSPASESDVGAILQLIRGLAEYEKLSHEAAATEEDLRRWLFGASPAAEVLMAFAGEQAVGFALFFTSFSTFVGKPGIYLEDLFVLPAWRGRGVGSRLFRAVARVTVERNSGRLEWAVLDWNDPALNFYRKLGAVPMDQWTVQRLTGQALQDAAG